MKNFAPLLILGGAAVLAMGGGKKKAKRVPGRLVFHASGKNLFARGMLQAALLNQGLNSTMMDQNDLAEAFDSAWANADGLIVAIDLDSQGVAGAWAAAAEGEKYTSQDVAGTMAKAMSMEELGTLGVQEALNLAKSAKVS